MPCESTAEEVSFEWSYRTIYPGGGGGGLGCFFCVVPGGVGPGGGGGTWVSFC